MMRDTSLSTFHGLGKLLYNKRLAPSEENEGNVRGGSNRSDPNIKLNVAAWAQRNPMDGFDPERVLEAAGLDAGSVAAFLHENLCSFVENSAIEDLAGCLDEISASDVLAAGTRRRGDAADGSLDDGGAAVAASAAGSVAARGVCFWNSHPAPRSFHPLKKPELFTVQRLMASNAEQLELAASAGRVLHGGSGGLESKVAVAAELMPYLRCICHPASGHAPADLIMQLPAVWKHWSNGTVHEYRAHAGAMQNGGAAEGRGELGGSGVLETIEDPDDW